MVCAHLADLHLGYRSGYATINGRNAREVDVERAWWSAVEDVIASKPDVITIAGDCFHHTRVSDFAKKAFIDGIRQMLERTHAAVIVAQGNHDGAQTADVLTPIMLVQGFSDRLWVVTEPKRIRFRTLGKEVAVDVFPFTTRVAEAEHELDPDPTADVNIMVVHAALRGASDADALPRFYGSERSLDVSRIEGYDVIAAGDYHEFTRLHPTKLAFYSGSIERTSSDIWKERAPKGWVLTDTDAGTLEFREVPTRRMLDGDPYGLRTAADVNEWLARCGPEIEGALVRLKVTGFPRAEREHIDQQLVRAVRARALHFQLDLEFAATEDAPAVGGTATLAQEAAAWDWGGDDVRELVLAKLGVEAEEREEVAA